MKLTAKKIKEAEAWVERNGLHPQACGALVRDFCKAMGISYGTYENWLKNETFANAITRARDVFHRTTVRTVENALVKRASGYEFTKERLEKASRKVVEYDPLTGKKVREYYGDPQPVAASRETIQVAPDVDAAKFVLTNMEPDRWKQKQEIAAEVDIIRPIVVRSEEERQAIQDLRNSDL